MSLESGFGGPTWNEEAKNWNTTFPYNSERGRPVITGGKANKPGNAHVKKLVEVRGKMAPIANATCRVCIQTMFQTAYFIAPRYAVTGLHFEYALKKSDLPSIEVKYCFADMAFGRSIDEVDGSDVSAEDKIWGNAEVVHINEEEKFAIIHTPTTHPFIPLDKFITTVQEGAFVAVIGYNAQCSKLQISTLWSKLAPDAKKEVVDMDATLGYDDFFEIFSPEVKVVAPGFVKPAVGSEFTLPTVFVTSSLFWGTTGGPALTLDSNNEFVIFGRVEGTVWEGYFNEVIVNTERFINALRKWL